MLLAASYIFYSWWDWRFFGLILLTSLTTFFTALLTSRNKHRKLLTSLNIIFNLGILVTFKYFNFFSDNLARLFELFGFNLDWFTIDVLLPVGISFYTLQAISYSVDVYTRKINPSHDIISFCTYIAYFPQLVAGPIERASNLLPQITKSRVWDREKAVTGMRMITLGLVKKLCLADILGLYVDHIFYMGIASTFQVLIVGLLFTLQIYFDFSAYSEIARGVSRLLGIELMANFRFPYFSRNILEFWQRWHISLMQWLRDYVYIPLGGNRKGRRRTLINIAIVFFISGLWHGAGWNFILWGVYWGICYIVGKTVIGLKRPEGYPTLQDMPNIILTLGFVCFGLYIFRCSAINEISLGFKNIWAFALLFLAFYLISLTLRLILKKKYLLLPFSLVIVGSLIILFLQEPWYVWLRIWWILPALMVLIIEWNGRRGDYPLENVPKNKYLRYAFYWACMIMIILSEPTDMRFIYFQF